MKAEDVSSGKMHICTYTSSFKRWGRGIFGRDVLGNFSQFPGRSPAPFVLTRGDVSVELKSEPLDTRHPASAIIKIPFISFPSFLLTYFKTNFKQPVILPPHTSACNTWAFSYIICYCHI